MISHQICKFMSNYGTATTQAHWWVIAATSSMAVGNAAYDVAVSMHPQERVLLRQGIRVIRQHDLKSGTT